MRGPRNFSNRKPKHAIKTLGRILGYMLNKKWLIILVTFFIVCSSGAGVAGTYFLRPLLNDGILPLVGRSVQPSDFQPLLRMLAMLIGIYFAGVISTYIYNRIMIYISNSTLNRIRRDLFHRMQDLPVSYFDTHTHGELMSRFTSDVDTLRDAIGNGLGMLLTSAITVTSTFVMMLILSPVLTILIIGMLFVIFFVIKVIGGKSAKYFKKQQMAVGEVNGYIEEVMEGIKVVKVFHHEDAVKEEFARLNENLREAATNANTFASIIMPIMGNLSYLNYAFTAALGAVLIVTGWMDIGSIASYLQYTRSFSFPITQISQQFNAILAALAGAERIFEIIDEQPEQDEGFVALVNATEENGVLKECEQYTGIWAWKKPQEQGGAIYTKVLGKVEFESVTFGYDERKTVLHDLSLYAKPGQKIAFVGSTGAGKTTITNLINRFYDLRQGTILYDGIPIRDIKKDDLRRSLAMVLQNTHLFTDTVRENIRYGKLDATDEEVVAAAKLANADAFIRHLPDGYDTMLTADGANLSQGQRQLLAIARAAVANPPVLILDEATSSIDTRTERFIERGMDMLMEGRTVFVIAHRLSTVRNADAIMVLENGEIIERGNHDELIDQKGKYYQLYMGQFELS